MKEEASKVQLDHLDFLRVVGNLCVVLFHSLLYWAALFPLDDVIEEMNRHSLLKVIAHGNFAVDLFMVISGLLAAWQTESLSSSESPSKPPVFSVKSYLWGRCRRLLPPYFGTLIAIYLMLPNQQNIPEHMRATYDVMFAYCHQTMPLSLFLVNNFVGFGGCGVHLWSVAVQMHLFVIFAGMVKLLGQRSSRMILASSCVFLVGAATRAFLSAFIGIAVPLPPFDHPTLSSSLKDAAFYFYHTLYFATPSRLCNFFAGVLLAFFMQSSTHRRITASRKGRAVLKMAVATALAAAMAAYSALIASIEYDGSRMDQWRFSNAWAAWMLHGSPILSLAFALVVCGTLSQGNLSRSSTTTRWLHVLSKGSYGIYLIHPLVFYWNQFLMHKPIGSMCGQAPLLCLFVLFISGYLGSVMTVVLTSFVWRVVHSGQRKRWQCKWRHVAGNYPTHCIRSCSMITKACPKLTKRE